LYISETTQARGNAARSFSSCSAWRANSSMLALAATMALGGAPVARATDPTPPPITLPAVGDQVYNPNTGQYETVTQDNPPASVMTDKGNSIFIATTVGQTFSITNPDTSVTTNYTVTAVTANASGYVTSVSLTDASNVVSTQAVVVDESANLPTASQFQSGGTATGSNAVTFPSAGSGQVLYRNVVHGSNGSGGNNGFGVRICFFGCFTIGYPAGDGQSGANGGSVTDALPATHAAINSTTANTAGVIVQSIGGSGGKGGDAYGALPAGDGGGAGIDGAVVFSNAAKVTTSKGNSYGILVSSSSGKGGSGGSGYIFSSGGSGGAASGQGGDATVTNTGVVGTQGANSIGIYVQSLGGSAGDGGGSIGFVASSGGGSYGGKGGTATAHQDGTVQTSGDGAHGVLAESIGGSGGDGGLSGGLFADGSNGGAGGAGGTAIITAGAHSITSTTGNYATALFAQSVGGGGGNGGFTIGAVSLGSSGSQGSAGGNASVTAALGAQITTEVWHCGAVGWRRWR